MALNSEVNFGLGSDSLELNIHTDKYWKIFLDLDQIQ